MNEQQNDCLEKIIQMLHSCEISLQQLHESIEEAKQPSHVGNELKLDKLNYYQFRWAWSECISNLVRAANNLHFLRRDFEPQTKWLMEYMERVKSNSIEK